MIRSALIAVSALAAANVASAEEASFETVTVQVNASDLDLSKVADAKILYNRIAGAARQACGVKPRYGFSYHPRTDKTCVEDAIAGAIKAVNVATLNTVFAEAKGEDRSFETSAIEGWSDRA